MIRTMLLSQALLLILAACGGHLGGDIDTVTSFPHTNAVLPMHGATDFSTNAMFPAERQWYERIWIAIEHPEEEASADAASGNLYAYGRTLNLHVTDLLTALRATGDLRLLDEIDRLFELMRDELRTTWVDGSGAAVTPDDGTDGLLRWLYFNGDNDWRGRDTHVMDDGLTHSLVAAVAYAFEINRDLPSPNGIDYGERADFWHDYLVNHFERKWRIRFQNEAGTWPIMDENRPSPLMHTTVQWIRYHVYLYKLTSDNGYLREAERLASHVQSGLMPVSTPLGTAYVWDHWLIDGTWGAQPTLYARYTVQALHDLYLEGFLGRGEPEFMQRIANGIAHFVVDNGITDVAFDVCGGKDCNGIESRSGPRWSVHFFRPFALLIAYDRSGELRSIAEEVYDDLSPRFSEIPVGMTLALMTE